MKILYGLSDGALLQRNQSGFCECKFAAECDGALRTSMGTIERLDGKEYKLTGIPAGGEYEVVLSDDSDRISLHLWVGDLWMLGGQSNMEGAGWFTDEDIEDERHPSPDIRAYYLDNRWDAALPMLHEPWLSVDACQRDVYRKNHLASAWKTELPEFITLGLPKRGIGPGLFFAKQMQSITGVPQAVIPCALGGSSMKQWKPMGEDGDNLYAAMLRRFKRTGSHVRGLFWYQGCAETYRAGVDAFTDRMTELVNAVRRDFGDANLPLVQVQIAKTSLPGSNSLEGGLYWEAIREQQRRLGDFIPHMDTVAAIDGSRDDLIHLSSASHRKLGKRAALSMASLCGFGGSAAPKLVGMKIIPDECRPFYAALVLQYDHVHELVSDGAPSGFTITTEKDQMLYCPDNGIARVRFSGNEVILYTEYSSDDLKNDYVRYGYLNMGHCNIGDSNGHLLPAMGPIAISDYVGK